MPDSPVDYTTRGAVAFITLNRPERLNAIDRGLTAALEESVDRANREQDVRVIVLRGAGRAFCAGYDLQGAPQAEAAAQERTGGWDPVVDFRGMSQYVRSFMSLWESPKPVIAQVHGWCVGGGTDMALCSDLIFMAEDARIGYPPSRVWGIPTTAMWVYRMGLERAKRYLLTGDEIRAQEAARIGMILEAVPDHELQAHALALAKRMARVPTNQLVMLKLLCNQTVESMGFASSRLLGTLFDGIARHTQEGLDFVERAQEVGFRQAVRERDDPFQDYGSRPQRDSLGKESKT